jgi:NAD-dependent deacetylase
VTGAAELGALIRQHQPCVALTGAGISTESGIPDFRSPPWRGDGEAGDRDGKAGSALPAQPVTGGLWAKYDPMDYATLRSFRADPARVWEFYGLRYEALTRAEPNAGHLALAELERRGLVRAVITQNIDMLHERAGTRELVEVHGSIRTASCPRCGRSYAAADVLARLPVPACDDDGAVLKPDVVFFGELLPEAAIERAFELARAAELLLVVGSTLEVHPVAGLPLEARRFAIVNVGPTALDPHAALRVEGKAGEILPALL